MPFSWGSSWPRIQPGSDSTKLWIPLPYCFQISLVSNKIIILLLLGQWFPFINLKASETLCHITAQMIFIQVKICYISFLIFLHEILIPFILPPKHIKIIYRLLTKLFSLHLHVLPSKSCCHPAKLIEDKQMSKPLMSLGWHSAWNDLSDYPHSLFKFLLNLKLQFRSHLLWLVEFQPSVLTQPFFFVFLRLPWSFCIIWLNFH